MASRGGGFFLSMWEDLQKVESLTKTHKLESDFMNLATYDDLRQSLVEFLPELGALVSSMGCTAFDVVRGAGLVLKPLLVAEAPKKRKKPTHPGTAVQKVAKLKFAAERSSKDWFV